MPLPQNDREKVVSVLERIATALERLADASSTREHREDSFNTGGTQPKTTQPLK